MITVRPATASDAADIARVSVETWRAAYRHILPADYLEALSIPVRARQISQLIGQGAAYWVAIDEEDQIVGFVSVGDNEEKNVPAESELKAIYVVPTHHGRGIGRALLLTGTEHLASIGCNSLCAFAFQENHIAGAFYRSLGAVEYDKDVYSLNGVDYPDQSFVWHSVEDLVSRLRQG